MGYIWLGWVRSAVDKLSRLVDSRVARRALTLVLFACVVMYSTGKAAQASVQPRARIAAPVSDAASVPYTHVPRANVPPPSWVPAPLRTALSPQSQPRHASRSARTPEPNVRLPVLLQQGKNSLHG